VKGRIARTKLTRINVSPLQACSSASVGDVEPHTQVTRAQLAYHLRRCVAAHLYDDSGVLPHGVAIYSLSDPRAVRQIRYIGQTSAPRRRLLQHLNTSRLWLPDELPWWVKSPKLRPLYTWIRELYGDGNRLPVMVVSAWVDSLDARSAERARIQECLAQHLPLLNIEAEC
jgi:hypothetical protein